MTNKLNDPGPHYSCGNCFSWVLWSKVITIDDHKGHFCSEDCSKKWSQKNQKKDPSTE